ncbi:hypothetical protein JG687_00009569 [Phytophthora cactorum]|uniref:Uncharacterized protein n=1 Tax=Phytophthora cactorum TaxID=29920 RepID=A0A8T1U9I5_9STRA|nr:hypothetical protein JG687_00009569 [Phytophthora cactorum]
MVLVTFGICWSSIDRLIFCDSFERVGRISSCLLMFLQDRRLAKYLRLLLMNEVFRLQESSWGRCTPEPRICVPKNNSFFDIIATSYEGLTQKTSAMHTTR